MHLIFYNVLSIVGMILKAWISYWMIISRLETLLLYLSPSLDPC